MDRRAGELHGQHLPHLVEQRRERIEHFLAEDRPEAVRPTEPTEVQGHPAGDRVARHQLLPPEVRHEAPGVGEPHRGEVHPRPAAVERGPLREEPFHRGDLGAAEDELHGAPCPFLEGGGQGGVGTPALLQEQRELVDHDEAAPRTSRPEQDMEEGPDVGELRPEPYRGLEDPSEVGELVPLGPAVTDEDVGLLPVGELAEQPGLTGPAAPEEQQREGVLLVGPPPREAGQLGLAVDESLVLREGVERHNLSAISLLFRK